MCPLRKAEVLGPSEFHLQANALVRRKGETRAKAIVKEGRKEKQSVLCTDPAAAKLLQSCPTLCDPRDGSSPGSPVPGILQARTLEWVAISFSAQTLETVY